VAFTQGPVIRAILEPLALPTEPPLESSARGPPELPWGGPAE